MPLVRYWCFTVKFLRFSLYIARGNREARPVNEVLHFTSSLLFRAGTSLEVIRERIKANFVALKWRSRLPRRPHETLKSNQTP